MKQLMIHRHRTAIRRREPSRPIRLALQDQLITPTTSVFDYGCGLGDDVRHLVRQGISCRGWDPAYQVSEVPGQADIVNLGYVINVIEDVGERSEVLRQAWALARHVLVVAARLWDEGSREARIPYGDGYVTGTGTFQRYYQQAELRDWITAHLGVPAVAAGPGVFYVFRSEQVREGWFATRYRRVARAPAVSRSHAIFEAHRVHFEELMSFIAARGRLPGDAELEAASHLRRVLGSLSRATRIIQQLSDPGEWQRIRDERSQDLLIYIALSRFGRRPPFEVLPVDLQLDVRAFFGSYRTACKLADELLYAAGDLEKVNQESRIAQVGKLMPSALYVHVSALSQLPALLRVYEGCARAYLGVVDTANIVKLHREKPQISYLDYADFEQDPHPPLKKSVKVHLQTFQVDYRDYEGSENPPILHRKELFVGPAHPLRERYARLTRQEERAGLYEYPEQIGTRDGWQEILALKGLRLNGHRLVRIR